MRVTQNGYPFSQNKKSGGINMIKKIMNFIAAEEGQGMTEYGLVLGVIAIAVVGILITMRGQITQMFQNASDKIQQANQNP